MSFNARENMHPIETEVRPKLPVEDYLGTGAETDRASNYDSPFDA